MQTDDKGLSSVCCAPIKLINSNTLPFLERQPLFIVYGDLLLDSGIIIYNLILRIVSNSSVLNNSLTTTILIIRHDKSLVIMILTCTF